MIAQRQSPRSAQTDAASAPPEYAGPLLASKSYGTDDSHIVYNYPPSGNPGTSEDPNQSGNDTRYNATNSALWEGSTYSDSAADVNGGASGTYGSDAASGPGSWSCTVIRHNGWQTAGAWQVGANLTSPSQTAATFPDGTHELFAGAGWGANNTGPRVPNGQYNVQFTFGGLTLANRAAVGGPSAFCAARGVVVAAQWCWSLTANYDGATNDVWSSLTTQNAPSDSSTATVSAFAPRNTR